MKKYKGIIFDIDGTLTSTNELIFASFNHVTNKYFNKTLSNEEIISLFGPTEDVILKEWLGDDYEIGKKEYYEFYETNHHMADLYPGIKVLLENIRKKNIPLSIYTGKGKTAAIITLRKLEIYDLFDLIITGDDVKDHKPSAEGVEIFLNKFNLKKDEVIIVGDSPADINAARNAGIEVASVVWDSYAKDKVVALGADFIFDSVEDLSNFLLNNI